ncbi:MAG: hypothetical protein IJ736_15710 [Firmicutes bacterium]|nr:hypothetical protein [Bacillota bacterium]
MNRLKKMIAVFISLIIIVSGISVYGEEGKSFDIGGKSVNVGDYFQVGKYKGIPVVWRCIKIDENGPLMLSDKVICLKAFDEAGKNEIGSHGRGGKTYTVEEVYSESKPYPYDADGIWTRTDDGSNYWGDSNIRDWLNSDAEAGKVVWSCGNPPNIENSVFGKSSLSYDNEAGFLNGFTESEKSLLKTATQKQLLAAGEYMEGNKLHANFVEYLRSSSTLTQSYIDSMLKNYDNLYGTTTTEKVFLLDLKQYFELKA